MATTAVGGTHSSSLELDSFVMCIQKCDVEVVEWHLLDLASSSSQRNQVTLPAGSLAKVKEVHISKKSVQIRIYDFYSRNLAFENNLFACATIDLHTIAPPLWPFLVAIPEPIHRMKLFRYHELVAYLLTLKLEDFVLVDSQSVGGGKSWPSNLPVYLTCIIRYIGLISEIGPGFYLGVEITVN